MTAGALLHSKYNVPPVVEDRIKSVIEMLSMDPESLLRPSFTDQSEDNRRLLGSLILGTSERKVGSATSRPHVLVHQVSMAHLQQFQASVDRSASSRHQSGIHMLERTNSKRALADSSIVNATIEIELSKQISARSWNIDLIDMNARTGGHVLSLVAKVLFDKRDLFKTLKIDPVVARNFFGEVESRYKPVPYHCASHGTYAAHVAFARMTVVGRRRGRVLVLPPAGDQQAATEPGVPGGHVGADRLPGPRHRPPWVQQRVHGGDVVGRGVAVYAGASSATSGHR